MQLTFHSLCDKNLGCEKGRLEVTVVCLVVVDIIVIVIVVKCQCMTHKSREPGRRARGQRNSIITLSISSPEAAILIDCARDRDLWGLLKAR